MVVNQRPLAVAIPGRLDVGVGFHSSRMGRRHWNKEQREETEENGIYRDNETGS